MAGEGVRGWRGLFAGELPVDPVTRTRTWDQSSGWPHCGGTCVLFLPESDRQGRPEHQCPSSSAPAAAPAPTVLPPHALLVADLSQAEKLSTMYDRWQACVAVSARTVTRSLRALRLVFDLKFKLDAELRVGAARPVGISNTRL